MSAPYTMRTALPSRTTRSIAIAVLVAASSALSALAAGPASAPAGARSPGAKDSAACSRIAEHGARANCLSEASTRRAATQPTVPTESADLLRQNAVKRCEPLPEAERKDCYSRMKGQGTVNGSVEGGGLLRELVTREVGAAPYTASAPAPRPASAP